MKDDGSGRQKLDAARSAVVAAWIRACDRGPRPSPDDAGNEAEGGGGTAEQSVLDRHMPTPQAAAVAVMALLSAGVILGLVTDQIAHSASAPIVVLDRPASAPEAEPEEEAPEVETEYSEEEGPAATVVTEAPAATPEEVFEETSGEGPIEEPKEPIELPTEAALPPVSHLFVIVLGEHGYETAFGERADAPYLSELVEEGELLQNYYAVAPGGLANEIALLSGQGPTAQTAAGCPEPTDITPGTIDPNTVGGSEAVTGTGCVYPASTQTLPNQLVSAGSTWKAYVEEDPDVPAQPPCSAGRSATAYFHSLLDNGECAASTVGIGQLAADLASKSATAVPTVSYIAQKQPASLEGAEAFLRTVVPKIESSPYFAVGGMIAITFASAPQTGPEADPSSCCATPEYPNLKDPSAPAPPAASGPVKPTGGGGRVGMLLLSPYVAPGSVNETYYDHFSFLRSVEEILGQAPLGYAAEPAIVGFDENVYNNLEG